MRKRYLIAGLTALLLGAWFFLPLILPELPLTKRPREYTLAAPPSAPPVSHVTLPVELPLAALEARLTREVDASFADRDSDFQAQRSGPLRLSAQGRVVQMSLPLSFRSRSGLDTKGSLIVHTRLSANIGADWQPQVSVRSTFDWTRKPKVKVLFFKMRVSSVVGRSIEKKLAELDADLAKRVSDALRLKPRAEHWWQGLHKPDLLAEAPPIWLTVEPQTFYFDPLRGDGRNLKIAVGIRAVLKTSVLTEPVPPPVKPVPRLERATAKDEGFVLHLPVVADYAGLRTRLRQELVGRKIELRRGAITPTDFTLYTSGRNLVIGVDFRGDAPGFWFDTRGTVYFIGEPHFNTDTRVLSIENFHFTRRLSNPLLSTASWVLQDSLREELRARLRWDLNERLRDGARELTAKLNQPMGSDLQLTGAVEDINLSGIRCRAQGILIGLETRGHLKVTLKAPTG